jgi:hypothetical protein
VIPQAERPVQQQHNRRPYSDRIPIHFVFPPEAQPREAGAIATATKRSAVANIGKFSLA